MTKTLEATFDGAVFRPDEPVELQPNTRVQIIVTVKPTQDEESKSFLKVARSLRLQGPPDWSSRLDDYLYGGAKLDEQ
jgi:predicted DNA-binding antitoxin AbrB/MazE fold protein